MLLAVTLPDLKPNSQDTPALYLETVNLLWVWSLVLGLICAISATSLQQLARRYIRVTQPASGRCSPEMRARMRAYYYIGVRNTSLVIEGLPMLLHISLFLFFAGLHVYLSNLNHAVFKSVDWAIVLFSALYGFVTLIPIFVVDSPIFTPLSNPVYRLGNAVLVILTLPFICYIFFYGGVLSPRTRRFYLRRFSRRFSMMIGGLEKRAEGIVLGRSGSIDLRILRWSIRALGDDDTLEKFFEAIPGFFNSELVKYQRFPRYLLNRYWNALNGLLGRALSSNSVNSHRRIDISMNALSVLSSHASSHSSIPYDIFVRGWGRVTLIVTDEDIQHLIRWCTSDHIHTALYAQCVVACILARQPECDDRWIQIASDAFGLSEGDLRDNIAHGIDSVSLAISIHLIRQSIRSRFYYWDALKSFSELDIRNTLPRLQHDFCMLWIEVVLVARQQRYNSRPVRILQWSHSHYIDLHRGTDAAPTAFSSSTQVFDPIFRHSSSYPLCTIASHLQHSAAHGPAPDITPRPSDPLSSPLPRQSGDPPLFSQLSDPPVPAADLVSPDGGPHQTSTGSSTVLLQAGEGGISTGPPSDQTTANEIETPQAFTGHSTRTPN